LQKEQRLSLGYVLLWLVGISLISTVIRSARQIRRNRGWLIVSAACLLIIAVSALVFGVDGAGYIGFGLWLLLLVLPNTGTRYLGKLCLKQEFGKAALVSRVLVLFHPADGFLELPKMFSALALLKKGQPVEAQRKMQGISFADLPLGKGVITYLYSLEGDWKAFLEWARRTGGLAEAQHNPTVLSGYLRALGETGALNELIEAFWSSRAAIQMYGPSVRSTCELFLFAFNGLVDPVKQMLAAELQSYPEGTKIFWLATTELAAGRRETADVLFHSVASQGDIRLKKGIERRQTIPLADPRKVLTESNWQLLSTIAGVNPEVPRPATPPTTKLARPYVTYLLAAANLAVFGAEIKLGGSTDLETLFKMGGLLPEVVLQGEWWRLVASMFLHFGPLHLAMNLFAIVLVGPFVEQAMGKLKYLVVYFASGVLSMLTVTLLVAKGVLSDQFLVGASGAITGLIGATGAIFLKIWHSDRTAVASRRLSSIGMAILLQTAFDLSTRQVSFTAHISGALFGFLVGLLLPTRKVTL